MVDSTTAGSDGQRAKPPRRPCRGHRPRVAPHQLGTRSISSAQEAGKAANSTGPHGRWSAYVRWNAPSGHSSHQHHPAEATHKHDTARRWKRGWHRATATRHHHRTGNHRTDGNVFPSPEDTLDTLVLTTTSMAERVQQDHGHCHDGADPCYDACCTAPCGDHVPARMAGSRGDCHKGQR